MKNMQKYILAMLLTLFFFCRYAVANEAVSTTKQYIVYMGEHSFSDSNSLISSNHDLLASVTGSIRQAEDATTHHYHKSFRGFSAKLTPEQAQILRETKPVISVFESKISRLHTTHSWEFLGIDAIPQIKQPKMEPKLDVIIGVIDSGVWPESESFNDNELGPKPKFKGKCVTGNLSNKPFKCNKKIIGGRFYSKGLEEFTGPFESLNKTFFRSPRDSDGHGTHTTSIIAGSEVNLTLFDASNGIARGGMPNARLAIYKACWFFQCAHEDILSAFDDAIHDGVHIISVSAGSSNPTSFFTDVYSIGSFHASKEGILVSASAGNGGTLGSVENNAPWTLTAAASTTDREFNSNVELGNSMILKGSSINPLKMDRYYGLIDAAASAVNVAAENASFCYGNTLDSNLIKGKIVVCTASQNESSVDQSVVVRDGGGVGMILIDPISGNEDIGHEHVIPTTVLDPKEVETLQDYFILNNQLKPTARGGSTTIKIGSTIQAPKMAMFSSRGPNPIAPDIIKPDITAPGVNILAAWPPASGKGVGYYKFDSGTSMSCPHVSAVAAIIKSYHPTWSPAAIKSAIMTTATEMDNTKRPMVRNLHGSPTTPLDYGSGHINPAAAIDPGLIYDYNTTDMINFLCNSIDVNLTIFPSLVTCPNPPIPNYDLNYPSIGVFEMNGHVSVRRTVTYCGKGPTVFKAKLSAPAGVTITLKPKELEFKKSGEQKSFDVSFLPDKTSFGGVVFGSLTWSNRKYNVKSPILVGVRKMQ